MLMLYFNFVILHVFSFKVVLTLKMIFILTDILVYNKGTLLKKSNCKGNR